MNLELITKQVANTCRSVSTYIRNELKNLKVSDIHSKGVHDFVTYVDKTSEKKLIRDLRRILPTAGIIAEENHGYKKSDLYNWIIDPLDGTTNFIHGVPMFAISIALMKGGEVVSGVVSEINLHEYFYAWKDGGAFMNGHPINVSQTDKLNDSLMATGFPYHDFERLDPYIEVLKYLMRNTHGVRRLGSAAVDLAYVACGRYDGFYEYGLNSWDVAAGSILVKEAGGMVSDFSASDRFVFGREIVATNQGIGMEFLEIVKRNFQ
jgi:myo-inositol-1(or 4)-monophosphatase